MAVSVSISSQTTSQKKVIWSWAVSEKNNKFGSAQTDSAIVGSLIAVHSALLAVPGNLDVIIRTQYNSVAEILNTPDRETKNPLVAKIFQIIKARPGKVTAMVITQVSMSENDRRAYKMTSIISNPTGAARKKPATGSLLSPSRSTKVKVSVTAKKPAVKRRKLKEVLITGLEDDYDTPLLQVTQPAAGKPVMCDSCDGPINPLTFECFCSA